MTDILSELARVKAIFQLRAIKSAMGFGPTELHLTPDQIITPGERVRDREARSKLSAKAHSEARVKWLRECRERFSDAD